MEPALIPLVAIGAGLALLLLAVLLLRSTRAFAAAATRVQGTVTALQPRGDAAAPTVEFRDGDRVVRFTSTVASQPPEFAVGDRVEVLYPPGEPGAARIRSFWQEHLPAALVGGLGALLVVAGALDYAVMRSAPPVNEAGTRSSARAK